MYSHAPLTCTGDLKQREGMTRSHLWPCLQVVALVSLVGCGGNREEGGSAATATATATATVTQGGDADGDGTGSGTDGSSTNGSTSMMTGPLLDVLDNDEGMMDAGDDTGPGMGTACEQAAATASSQGCEFWAVDLPNAWQVTLGTSAEDQAFGVVVTNTASEVATVEVFVGKQGAPLQTAEIQPGGLRVFKFGNALNTTPIGNNKGFAYRIESDLPVTAYQYNPLDNSNPVYSNDASLLFPTHVLDLDYTAITGDAL